MNVIAIDREDIDIIERMRQNPGFDECYRAASQFFLIWILYNKLYNTSASNRNSPDGKKFKRFFCRIGRDYYGENKGQIIGNFRETKLSNGSPRESVQNLGRKGNVTFSESHESIEILADNVTFSESHESIEILADNVTFSESHESIEILADVIYTIRCNLLHGDKDIILSDSDNKLVSWASDVLYHTLEHYYSIQNRRDTL